MRRRVVRYARAFDLTLLRPVQRAKNAPGLTIAFSIVSILVGTAALVASFVYFLTEVTVVDRVHLQDRDPSCFPMGRAAVTRSIVPAVDPAARQYLVTPNMLVARGAPESVTSDFEHMANGVSSPPDLYSYVQLGTNVRAGHEPVPGSLRWDVVV